MPELILTEQEKSKIEEWRAENAHKEAVEQFHAKAFLVCFQFKQYSVENYGAVPSFSEFVNSFGYDEKDHQMMFEVLTQVWKLIHSLVPPRGTI